MGINDINNKDMMISEDELLNVSGGALAAEASAKTKTAKSQIQRIACQKCGRPFYADLSKESCKCPMCSHSNTFLG